MIDENDRMREVRREEREDSVRGDCVCGASALPDVGRRGAPTLPRIVANFKHLLAARYGLRFQRDFWDTRLRDEAHYAEKFRYVCNNPVRKGLCASAREWRPVIAFDRESGVERRHR